MLEATYSIVRECLAADCPAQIPVDIVEYKNLYAYRISLDDLNALPEQKKQDFALWLVERAKIAKTLSGIPVNIEWEE